MPTRGDQSRTESSSETTAGCARQLTLGGSQTLSSCSSRDGIACGVPRAKASSSFRSCSHSGLRTTSGHRPVPGRAGTNANSASSSLLSHSPVAVVCAAWAGAARKLVSRQDALTAVGLAGPLIRSLVARFLIGLHFCAPDGCRPPSVALYVQVCLK